MTTVDGWSICYIFYLNRVYVTIIVGGFICLNFLFNSNSSGSEDDDAPVQGPINKEPFEKLYPGATSGESGIRKLYVHRVCFASLHQVSHLKIPWCQQGV